MIKEEIKTVSELAEDEANHWIGPSDAYSFNDRQVWAILQKAFIHGHQAMEEYANQQKSEIVKATLEYVAEHAQVMEVFKYPLPSRTTTTVVNKRGILNMEEDILKQLNK